MKKFSEKYLGMRSNLGYHITRELYGSLPFLESKIKEVKVRCKSG
jgi:hypothetical protein